MYSIELRFFYYYKCTISYVIFFNSLSCSYSICVTFSPNYRYPIVIVCCCPLCTRSALRKHSLNSLRSISKVSCVRRCTTPRSPACASRYRSNAVYNSKYFLFSIASFFSYSAYKSYSIRSFRPCVCTYADCELVYNYCFWRFNLYNSSPNLASWLSFCPPSPTSSASYLLRSSSSCTTIFLRISSSFFSNTLLHLFFSARSFLCTSTTSASWSSNTAIKGLIS